MLRVLSAMVLPAILLAPVSAGAQAEAEPDGDSAKAESKGKENKDRSDVPRKEGDYQGVKPGHSSYSPRRSKRPVLTWVGFEPKEDGTSRLFLQLNREVEYDQRMDDKGVFHLTLVGARYAKRNTIRRLDTRFFDTSVSLVTSKRARRSRARGNRPAQRAGVKLSIHFKTPEDSQQPQISMSKAEDGYHYLYLSFPPAKERPDEAAQTDAGDDDVAP